MYIIIDKKNEIMISTTDQGGVCSYFNKSKDTVKNWFRSGKVWYESKSGDFIVAKVTKHVKSGRNFSPGATEKMEENRRRFTEKYGKKDPLNK